MPPRISQTSLQHGKKKHPRSDWVAAMGHYDQKLPAQPEDVSDYILWGTKHFNKPRSLISLSVFSMTSFPAFLRWVSTLIPWTVASLSPWTHTIGSQESFFVLDTGPSNATPCDSSSWAQAITHLIHFSLPSGWDCAGWERLDFASLDHSCLPTSLPLVCRMLCDNVFPFLVNFLSSLPCEFCRIAPLFSNLEIRRGIFMADGHFPLTLHSTWVLVGLTGRLRFLSHQRDTFFLWFLTLLFSWLFIPTSLFYLLT